MLSRILLIALAASTSAMADFVNGSFTTGDLTGWTHYLTAGGDDDFGDVASFDTTGTGASFAARFEVGQAAFNPGAPAAGAGIRQSLFLQPGTYNLALDIASLGGTSFNSAGGIFTALLGGTTLDTYNFGPISASPATLRASMSIPVIIASAGTYEFSFQFVRPFATASDTPDNFLDNVQLTGSASAVPETADWTIAALALGGVAAATRLRRA